MEQMEWFHVFAESFNLELGMYCVLIPYRSFVYEVHYKPWIYGFYSPLTVQEIDVNQMRPGYSTHSGYRNIWTDFAYFAGFEALS